MKDTSSHFHLQCIGVNHWKANLDVREAFYIDSHTQNAFLEAQLSKGVTSIFVVSTCNRTEVYFDGGDAATLIADFCALNAGSLALFQEFGFHLEGQNAIRHLFELACGIDSMILGDMQIIAQIKAGAQMSNQIGGIKGPMYRLLDTVIKSYKIVRTETQISSGAASVAHAGVLCVKQHIQNPADVQLLLFGMGKIGEVTCHNLYSQGFTHVTLMNRTLEKASTLSQKLHFEVQPIEELQSALLQHDVILVATGASHYLIQSEHFTHLTKPVLILDLATPRNVNPEVGNHSLVTLVNLDMLNRIQDDTLSMRLAEIPKVKAIIEREESELLEWIELSQLNGIFKEIKDHFHAVKQLEMQQYKHIFNSSEYEKVEKLTESIVNKLARRCITQIKTHYKETGAVSDLAKILFDFKDKA